MTTTINVGIIGLGRIGASVGLALKRYNARKDARQQFTITGYPAENLQAQQLKGLDPVADHLARSVLDAAANKDIIVLALPYRDVQPAYQAFAKDLRSGAVLLDLSPLKLPSQSWADKYLSKETHLVGATPILNPKYLFDGMDDTEHAAADLFDGGTMLVTPSASSDRDAVQLAADFAELLGATPFFGDPAEHDVWAAAAEGLPAALGLAAFYALKRGDGWNDVRRVGNPAFGRLTHQLFDQHPDDLRDLLLNNRENVVRQIDSTVEALQALRGLLAANERAGLEDVLIDATDTYVTWIVHRREGRWDRQESPIAPSKSELLMNGMFGSFLTKRFKGEKNEEDDEK